MRSSAGLSSGSSGAASSVKRIQRELKEIAESPSRHWTASPAADDLFEWQFAIRGPPGTDFEGGIYTGRIVLPSNYPLAPPSIMLLTPSGRWEVGKKICLSNSNYHPELWQPAWGIRTMMEALRSHFPVPGDGAIGSLDWPSDLRRQLARESLDFVCNGKRNRELLPELSPEEIKEEGGAVPTELLPTPVAAPAPAVSEAAAVAPPPSQAPAPTPLPVAAAPVAAINVAAPAEGAAVESSSGLRQRRHDGAQDDAAGVTAVASETAAVGSPQRRRRDNTRPQRRQQSVLLQIFKPPATKRGRVLLVLDIGIFILVIVFVATFVHFAMTPPTILEPFLDREKSKKS